MNAKLNWRPGLPDHRDFLFKDKVPMSLAALPKVVDLSPSMSPIKDQDQLGCCVGESSVAAVELLERQFGIDQNFSGSELFAYYNARADKRNDTGAFIRDSVKAMAKLGVASENLWPFNERKFATKPPGAAFADGLKQTIKDYLRATTITEIRQALAQHHPVLLGFTCYESLMSDATAKTGVVKMPAAHEAVIGGHAICLVGYDDNKKLLKFKNSWGTGWGKKGYGFLPYEYVPKLSDDYWVIRK